MTYLSSKGVQEGNVCKHCGKNILRLQTGVWMHTDYRRECRSVTVAEPRD